MAYRCHCGLMWGVEVWLADGTILLLSAPIPRS